jgi:hypothetical protein
MPIKRKRSGQRPSPERTTAGADMPRRCPRCGRNTLAFAPSVAVIVQPESIDVTGGDEDRKLRLQYKPAWLCRNDKCRYVRLVRR